jgi:long-subunit acyl-CoA synthetase (AMP-forming)
VTATPREAAHAHYQALRRRSTPGLVLFSSGTSGSPKAAVHDLGRLLQKFIVPRHAYRTLVFLQLDHIGGLNTLFYTLANGGTVVIADGRAPTDVCRRSPATGSSCCRRLPHSQPAAPLGGASPPRSLVARAHHLQDRADAGHTLERVHAAFPRVRLLQTYGLSSAILRSQSRDAGSPWIRVGGEGFETKVVHSRLFVRAQSAMLGYLNAPSPFDAEGFFDTGDLVEQDGE